MHKPHSNTRNLHTRINFTFSNTLKAMSMEPVACLLIVVEAHRRMNNVFEESTRNNSSQENSTTSWLPVSLTWMKSLGANRILGNDNDQLLIIMTFGQWLNCQIRTETKWRCWFKWTSIPIGIPKPSTKDTILVKNIVLPL